MRLNKYLARCGVAARRKCDELVFDGKVRVNGEVVTEPWRRVDPHTDEVRVGAKRVEPPGDRTYLLLHKPPDVITTASDPQGRPTVVGLVAADFPEARLYPVGRLDADTTGALLLTDDGELAHRLPHPKYQTAKEYVAELTSEITDEELERIRVGLELEDGPARPDELERMGGDVVRLTLHEGRKHIVKRMFDAVGRPVGRLHRSRFAGLSADGLEPGSWRELSCEEVQGLRELVGLSPRARKDR